MNCRPVVSRADSFGNQGTVLASATTLVQGFVVEVLGGAIDVLVSVPATRGLNRVVADITGVPDLNKLPPWLFVSGLAFAVVMDVLGSTAAGWTVGQLSPMAHLRR